MNEKIFYPPGQCKKTKSSNVRILKFSQFLAGRVLGYNTFAASGVGGCDEKGVGGLK